METNAVIICTVLGCICILYAAFLYKKEPMIEVYTTQKAGKSVHLSCSCGGIGKGPRDTWRLPLRFLQKKKVVKVEWCKTCASGCIV